MKHNLCVHFKGQLRSELELCVDTAYTLGRNEKADIPLLDDKSLSRQHLSLQFENEKWQVKKLSKLGQLIYQGHEVQQIELQNNDSFSTGFYTFYYVQKQAPLGATGDAADEVDAVGDAALEDHGLEEGHVQESHDLEGHAQEPEEAGRIDGHQDVETPEAYDAAHNEVQSFEHADAQNEAAVDAAYPSHAEGAECADDYNNNIEAGADTHSNEATDDGTHISSGHLDALLNIVHADKYGGEKHLSLKLEGDSWIAGRKKTCPIYIKSSKMSRQHFEITKQGNQYFVTDLESSNGTKLNGVALTPKQQTPLLSGDRIRVKNIQFEFKIQQAHQHEDMTHVFAPAIEVESTSTYQAEAEELKKAHDLSRPPQPAHQMTKKKSPVKLWIMGVIVVLGAWWLSSPTPTPLPRKPTSEKKTNSKKQQLQAFYEVAHTHYVEGKYELCLEQIKKITQLQPGFELAARLKMHCHQALQVHQFNEQRQQKAQQNKKLQYKVQEVVKACKTQKHKFKSLEALRSCLSEAIALDPENPGLSELEIFVENKLQAQRQKKIKSQKQQRRYNKAQVAFQKAVQQFDKKNFQRALALHKKFISTYSDVGELTTQSKKQIKSIQQHIHSQSQTHFNECQSAFDNQEYKQAFDFCQKALKIDRRHAKAKKLTQKIQARVCKKTKTLFADANFHEYGGNITAAKEKLNAILNTGVPQCPQYAKAQRKLKKYGLGDNN